MGPAQRAERSWRLSASSRSKADGDARKVPSHRGCGSKAGSIDSAKCYGGHLNSSSHGSTADELASDPAPPDASAAGSAPWTATSPAQVGATQASESDPSAGVPPHLQWREHLQKQPEQQPFHQQPQQRGEPEPPSPRQSPSDDGRPRYPRTVWNATLPALSPSQRESWHDSLLDARHGLQYGRPQAVRPDSTLSARSIRLSGEDERCAVVERLYAASLRGGLPNQRFEDISRVLQDVFQVVTSHLVTRLPCVSGIIRIFASRQGLLLGVPAGVCLPVASPPCISHGPDTIFICQLALCPAPDDCLPCKWQAQDRALMCQLALLGSGEL